MSVLAAVADSLRSKIAVEATLLGHHVRAAVACQERIDAMQSKVEEIEAVLAEQPLALPLGGQPQLYAVL